MLSEGIPASAVGVLDHGDALEGLTSRQQLFASLSFTGLNDTEAYRRSGDCSGMSDSTVQRRAWEMAHAPKVQAKLRDMRQKRDEQTTLSTSLTREWIAQRLMHLADHADKDSVKVASLVALGKVAGIDLFRETTRVERVEKTVEQIDTELRERLSALKPVIDGSARQVEPVEPVQSDRRRKPRA